MGVMDIIGWIVFGLVVGAIARFLYPGPNPMGVILTMVLGVAGSLLGGFLGSSLFGAQYQAGGWIMSIIGALIVVWITAYMTSRSQVPRP